MARGDRGRKDAILDEATRLFAERGYEGTSMADLAEKVGLRKASLFHHFASKEQLRNAVLERLVGRVSIVMNDALAATSNASDFLQRLDALTDAIVGLMGEQPYAARLLLREAMDWGPTGGGPLAEAFRASLDVGEKFLLAGQRAGVIADGDVKHLIASMSGMHLVPFAMGGVMEGFVGHAPWTPEFIAARRIALRAHSRAILLKQA